MNMKLIIPLIAMSLSAPSWVSAAAIFGNLTVVDSGNICLEVGGRLLAAGSLESDGNGLPLQAYQCDGDTGTHPQDIETFELTAEGYLKVAHSNICIEAAGWKVYSDAHVDSANGVPLQAFQCNGWGGNYSEDIEKFELGYVDTITAQSGKVIHINRPLLRVKGTDICVDLEHRNRFDTTHFNGARAVLNNCVQGFGGDDEYKTESFHLDTTKIVRVAPHHGKLLMASVFRPLDNFNRMTSYCLQPANGNVALHQCDTNAVETLALTSGGYLKLANAPDLCLEVSNRSVMINPTFNYEGANLGYYKCTGYRATSNLLVRDIEQLELTGSRGTPIGLARDIEQFELTDDNRLRIVNSNWCVGLPGPEIHAKTITPGYSSNFNEKYKDHGKNVIIKACDWEYENKFKFSYN